MSKLTNKPKFYKNILNMMVEGYVLQAHDGSIIDYNQAACTILGLTPQQLEGKSSLDPDWRSVRKDGIPFPGEEHPAMVALKTGKVQKDVIMGVHTPKSELRWISINSYPIFDEYDEAHLKIKAYTTFKDITKELEAAKKIEQKSLELELVSERLNLAISGSGFGVWDFNPQTGQLDWDQSMFDLFGCHADEFEGAYQAWESRLLPEDIPSAVEDLQKALSGEKDFNTRFRIIDKSGAIKHIGGIAKVLRDNNGNATRMVGINWDSSKQVDYEETLKLAKINAENVAKAKSEFLANMSHEIRTPLNGVLGMLSILKNTDMTEEQREAVETIGKSGETLRVILNDILDISKIESGKLVINKSSFPLKETINNTIELYKALAKNKETAFEIKIDKVFDYAISDQNRFTQILNNLISNAVKFTSKGKITIEGQCSDNELNLKVIDTGIGISSDKIEHLFEPFYQGDSSITKNYGGTGLGLSICKKLVTLLEGELLIESELDQGSTFTLNLPFIKDEKIKDTMMNKTNVRNDLSYLKVLLVEDNPVNILVAQKVLKKIGINSDLAQDGEIAIEMAKNSDYDFIFMDLQMPNVDGITATKAILSRPSTKKPKIIAMTANAYDEDRVKCFDAGMVDFIAKPIGIEILIEKLNEHI